jgi:hypothetical protein
VLIIDVFGDLKDMLTIVTPVLLLFILRIYFCCVADCSSYSDLVECLQHVIECLYQGNLQPMVC